MTKQRILMTAIFLALAINAGMVFGLAEESFGSSDQDYFEAIFTASAGDEIGTAGVRLKKGFDFLDTDSSVYNRELALTAVTLAAQVYQNAQGDGAESILYGLGYDKVRTDYDSTLYHPGVCFGYKQLGKQKNLFAVAVRGTDNDIDKITSAVDGTFMLFHGSGENLASELVAFMKDATGKTEQELQQEDNWFFFTGFSLGGAVANCLSVNERVKKFAGSDKGKIYTYTFESPNTCMNLWGPDPESESNAFNFRVDGDAIVNLPPYSFAAAYGTDVEIKVDQLHDTVYRELFPDAEIDLADIGLHDICLGLLHIWQQAYRETGKQPQMK